MDDCERWAELADRRLLDEPLSDEEAQFFAQHPESCDACRAEAQAWQDLAEAEQEASLGEPDAQALIERALEAVAPPSEKKLPLRASEVGAPIDKKLPLREDIQKKLDVNTGHGIFMGGFYSTGDEHGKGCGFVTIGHEPKYHDYSTGFRCCKDPT